MRHDSSFRRFAIGLNASPVDFSDFVDRRSSLHIFEHLLGLLFSGFQGLERRERIYKEYSAFKSFQKLSSVALTAKLSAIHVPTIEAVPFSQILTLSRRAGGLVARVRARMFSGYNVTSSNLPTTDDA